MALSTKICQEQSRMKINTFWVCYFITLHWPLLIHSKQIPPAQGLWMFYCIIHRYFGLSHLDAQRLVGVAACCRSFLLLLSRNPERWPGCAYQTSYSHWIDFCLPTTLSPVVYLLCRLAFFQVSLSSLTSDPVYFLSRKPSCNSISGAHGVCFREEKWRIPGYVQ